MPQFERLAKVFRNSGIEKRHAVRPLGWYLQHLGWPERTAAFREAAGELFAQVAAKALDGARLRPPEIDVVITVTSTGIATPTLEVESLNRLGFRQNVSRVPVFGLGCAGGVTGLSIAARIAEGTPGCNVLLVVVELCTLAFRLDDVSKANIVATALFGDGAAACVVRAAESGGMRIRGSAEYTWPDTLGIMGWNVDAGGFGVVFSQDIPSFAESHLAAALRSLRTGCGTDGQEISRYVCHPGGSKVLTALESTLELERGALDTERTVLRDYGNMSAPTVLFVLDQMLDGSLPEPALLLAMGPGFTASCVLLDRST